VDRAAVFVDAGYLFAAGSRLIAGERLTRGELHLDHDVVLGLLAELTRSITGLPLLRIYWYDGTAAGPTPQQVALAYRPSVKLRLGLVNPQGQQEGVDSLVVTDLVNLARNRAMADALLLTGDDDIRVGVQEAQQLGVRVHLIGIEPARENQAGLLVQEADSVHELVVSDVRSFLTRAPTRELPLTLPLSASATPGEPATGTTALELVAQRIARELLPEDVDAASRGPAAGIPAHIDRRLLVAGTQAIGGASLTTEQKQRLRAAFLEACRRPSDSSHSGDMGPDVTSACERTVRFRSP
jgi:NYN domain